jgi:hypothetical protein
MRHKIVVRTAQWQRTGKQRWCAYRKDYLAQQGYLYRIAISELGRALYHGNVDPVAPKVGLPPVWRQFEPRSQDGERRTCPGEAATRQRKQAGAAR